MIIKARQVADEIENPSNPIDPFVITPLDIDDLKKSNDASVDLRLGCWFKVCRLNRNNKLSIYECNTAIPDENKISKEYYIKYGDRFILHPKSFVLGVTLEWIRMPINRAAYVVGKSSWGRYGLSIAAATGVHPGFTGSLTLELSNVGEIPIELIPGYLICQLFIHKVDCEEGDVITSSPFVGRRKPYMSHIIFDDKANQLKKLSIK